MRDVCVEQSSADEMLIGDWSSDVCSSGLPDRLDGRYGQIAKRRIEALIRGVAAIDLNRARAGPVEQCGDERRGGVAGQRLKTAGIVVGQIGSEPCRERVCR